MIVYSWDVISYRRQSLLLDTAAAYDISFVLKDGIYLVKSLLMTYIFTIYLPTPSFFVVEKIGGDTAQHVGDGGCLIMVCKLFLIVATVMIC